MGNNLNELNTLLFKTLKDLQDGSIDIKKAHAVTGVANTIINSAKVQLDMYKMVKEKEVASVFFGAPTTLKIEGDNVRDRKVSYARNLGFAGIVEAITEIGSDNFNRNFRKIESE